jgi:SRSO17 transposase
MPGLGGGAAGLDRWLAPFLEVMGRKTRRTWAPLYLRGLLGPGERKSLQPMAARLGLSGHDQLQHFIASPAWDEPRSGACWPRTRIGSWAGRTQCW